MGVTLLLSLEKELKRMPCLNISTKVPLDNVDTSSILSEATSSVAKLIGKPESNVAVCDDCIERICSHGLWRDRAASCLRVSIGGLGPDVNKRLSAMISAILETKLSVPKSRFFLKFYDTKATESDPHLMEAKNMQCLHALHQQ